MKAGKIPVSSWPLRLRALPASGRKAVPMNGNASYVSVAAALDKLTAEELSALAEKPELLKKFAGELVADIVANTYVVHMDDKDVPEQYREAAAKWRKYAASLGYTGPVAWKVREGFILKTHAPLAGPCYIKLEYLQDWDPKNDEPTKDSIVFWVPRLANGSTSKTITQMEKLRDKLRQRYELPAHHAKSFGSIAFLFVLILAHFKRTGERVPLKTFYAVSDSFHVDGNRLIAGYFDVGGLRCLGWVGHHCGFIGFFLLGVELL